MKVLKLIDKDDWDEGPWKDENDYLSWLDEKTKLPCIMRRNITGSWYAFVGIGATHPLFMIPPDDFSWKYLDVHGGIAHVGWLEKADLDFGPPAKHWWVGFNTNHFNDIQPKPGPNDSTTKIGKTYRTEKYVKKHTEELAAQLLELEYPHD